MIVCNPNNPTSTALPLDADRRLRRARAAPRLRDPRRGLLRVQPLDDPDASIDLLERHPNLVLLRTFSKVYGLARPARRLRAVRQRRAFVTAVNQVRQPFFCNAAAQAAAIEALSHRTRSPSASSAPSPRAWRSRSGLRDLGIAAADSQANFCWFDAARPTARTPRRGAGRRRPGRARRAGARRQRARPRRRCA